MPIPASANASAAKPPSRIVVKRRLAIEPATTSSIVATREMGTCASIARTTPRTAGVIDSGLPAVRTTSVIEFGWKYALEPDCEYGKYIVAGASS